MPSRSSATLACLLLAGLISFTACSGCDYTSAAISKKPGPSPDSSNVSSVRPEQKTDRDPNRLWCGEHDVYEDECLLCHPELAVKEETRDPNRLWCGEHDVYEDECVLCHPELAGEEETRDPNRLWCGEHDVYEDECFLCHPELADEEAGRDPNRLWCGAHDVYEDECVLCHPELADRGDGGGVDSSRGAELMCKEHRLAERVCGICHPELLANLQPGQGMKVRFESSASADKAGVGTGYPGKAKGSSNLSVLGQITYNKNKLAVLTPLMDGVLRRVLVDVGDTVEAGQLLAEINAPEFAREKNAYVKALADQALRREVYAREKDLHAREISARQDLEEAKAAFDASATDVSLARQRLLDLGLTEAEVDEVASSSATGSAMPLRAPFAGTVIERDAVMGAPASRSTPLFRIADLSTMWLELSVPESQMARLHVGREVAASFEPLPGESFLGVLTWISSSVDGVTRMLKARAELPNPEGVLRNAMFGQARLEEERPESTVTVPKDAVQHVDGRPVVFAKLEADLYESRLVALGAERGGQVEVLAGLSPVDEIVTRESYVLKSELLKARLGAGCVHE